MHHDHHGHVAVAHAGALGAGPQPPAPDAGGPTPPGFLPQTGAGQIGLLVALAALLTLGGGLLYRFGTRRES